MFSERPGRKSSKKTELDFSTFICCREQTRAMKNDRTHPCCGNSTALRYVGGGGGIGSDGDGGVSIDVCGSSGFGGGGGGGGGEGVGC